MFEVYIKDWLISNDDRPDAPRRSKEDITGTLNGIIPRPQSSMIMKPKGWVAIHDEEEDINFYFKPDVMDKLKTENHTAVLGFKVQEQRELFILNPPNDIYDKQEYQIMAEIEATNNIEVMQIRKFQSQKTQKKISPSQ